MKDKTGHNIHGTKINIVDLKNADLCMDFLFSLHENTSAK